MIDPIPYADARLNTNGSKRRKVTSAEQILDWAMTIEGTADAIRIIGAKLDFTDDEAAQILRHLDPALTELRRIRGTIASRDGSTCHKCGGSFRAARSDAMYCSPACRQDAYRLRRSSEKRDVAIAKRRADRSSTQTSTQTADITL